MSYRKPLIAAALALAGALAAGAANAGSDVHWSIGVNLPVYPNVSVGVSSAPPGLRAALRLPRAGRRGAAGRLRAAAGVPARRAGVCRAGLRAEPPVWKWKKHDRWDRRGDRHGHWDRHDDRRYDRHDRGDHDHDRHGR